MSVNPYTHRLLETALAVPDTVHRLGRALFLYVWLVTEANARGVVCREVGSIAMALYTPETEVGDWVDRLVASLLITVLTPPPHLVIKLPLWSGTSPVAIPKHAEIPAKSVLPKRDSEESLLKLSLQASSEAKLQATDEASLSKYLGEEGVGEGGNLLEEVRAVIGNHEGIPELLRRHPQSAIQEALAKARATPADQIKKSRAALFWFLIGKIPK